MATTQKRQFHKDERIYLVDCWGTSSGPRAFANNATIKVVEGNNVIVKLEGGIYQKYSIDDYGRLIFDTHAEAEKAAKKLPKPKSIIYLKNEDNTTSKYVVMGIWYKVEKETVKLVIKLENSEDIVIDRIGVDIFLSEESAKAKRV